MLQREEQRTHAVLHSFRAVGVGAIVLRVGVRADAEELPHAVLKLAVHREEERVGLLSVFFRDPGDRCGVSVAGHCVGTVGDGGFGNDWSGFVGAWAE